MREGLPEDVKNVKPLITTNLPPRKKTLIIWGGKKRGKKAARQSGYKLDTQTLGES